MTIVEFLLVRIAEDERAATSASRDDWDNVFVMSRETTEAQDEHIARHDPARVLAECEAKRRIVDAYSQAKRLRSGDIEGLTDLDHARLGGEYVALHAAVVRLAAVYADHPDYDQAWALDERAW